MKSITWVCLINGIAWVWCTYLLAAMNKISIAETLSKAAITEIIGVILTFTIAEIVKNRGGKNEKTDQTQNNKNSNADIPNADRDF